MVFRKVALGVATVIIILWLFRTNYLRGPRRRRRLVAWWESALQCSREHARVERAEGLLGCLWTRNFKLVWGQLW